MEKQELRKMLCDTLGIPKTTALIENQIFEYVSDLKLTYKEIARGLVFFITVEGGTYEAKYGIGIVPHVVERANAYYDRLRREKENQIKSVEDAKKIPDIILKVGQIRKRRKFEKMDINKIDVD